LIAVRRLLAVLILAFAAACASTQGSLVERYLLFFEADREEVTTLARGIIAQAASDVQAKNGSRLVVIGYASAAGDPTANLALSQRRAEAVAKLLVAAGVPVDRVSAAGRGEDLAAAEATYGRRVVIERFAP
jgi:outer membrane protein OmpA-like peptidoglycan-associated protein